MKEYKLYAATKETVEELAATCISVEEKEELKQEAVEVVTLSKADFITTVTPIMEMIKKLKGGAGWCEDGKRYFLTKGDVAKKFGVTKEFIEKLWNAG